MLNAGWRGLLLGCSALLLMAAVASAQPTAAGKLGNGSERAAVDDQEARDLFRLGKQAFDEGRFERALKYFKDAYDLSHRAALLSNIGTALDRLRRDQEALAAYRQYLVEVPDAPNRALIEDRVQVIEAAMNKTTSAGPLPLPPPAAAEPAPTPEAAARASTSVDVAAAPAAAVANDTPAARDQASPGIASRWWFWAGIGAIAVGAVVVGVAVGSSGGNAGVESPAVLGSATRVREL